MLSKFDKAMAGLREAVLWVGIPMLAVAISQLFLILGLLLLPYIAYLIFLLPVLAVVGFYKGLRKYNKLYENGSN